LVSRAKYRRLPELYVTGTEVVLADGCVIWMQVLNPFEVDEARHDAQTAKARLVMALSRPDSDETVKFEADLRDRARMVSALVEIRVREAMVDAVEAIRNDPDWLERLEIADRSEELLARPPDDDERRLLDDINRDYLTELNERVAATRDFEAQRLEALDADALRTEATRSYIDRRGGDAALDEYTLTELWYAARACDGVRIDDGWDHGACDSHRVRVWETKAEIRELPADLGELLAETVGRLNMSVREARSSARQGSSSDSSPLPSAPEESTPSTPAGTLVSAPGT
jgi:hypothetical protein